ncbi:hypothetical protein EOW77_0006865 [Bradyrhizobium yuanmingense]|nr:hypothetical protein EOW77_0006865 [Bradyrhizobium yuanmingense]
MPGLQFAGEGVERVRGGTVGSLCRHCEEPLRRSNPDCHRGGILDCFAALAMTTERSASQNPLA